MFLERIKNRIRQHIKLPMINGYNITWRRLLMMWLYPPTKHNALYHFEGAIQYNDDMLISIDTTNWVGWNIFCFGFYSVNLINLLKSIVKVGDVVVDVGANIGDITLILANRVGQTGKVYAFEPFPLALEKLQENCRLNNLKNVKALDFALSNLSGGSTLYCPRPYTGQLRGVGKTGLTGMSTLAKPDEDYMRGVEFLEFGVTQTTLDEFANIENLQRVDLIKIDAEGFDYKVIDGGRACISEFQPYIIFEYDPVWKTRTGYELGQAFQLLNGYHFYGIVSDSRKLLNRITEADKFKGGDILAVPKNRKRNAFKKD